MATLYTSRGRLHYGSDNWWLRVYCDQQLADYYCALLPKAWCVRRGKHSAHITVSRNEEPVNKAAWRKYDGQEIEFSYLPSVVFGKIYWWLDIYCVKLEEIRLELGLPVVNMYEPPLAGFRKRFHMTVGNNKEQ